MVLGTACWQAFEARNIQSAFSESKYIALSVASLFQAFLTGFPILVIVKDEPKAFYLVLTLMIPLRKLFKYEQIITGEVLENVAKTIVFTGLIVGFAYATEYFIAWYSHNTVEMEQFRWRALGDYRWGFYFMVLCNTLIPLRTDATTLRKCCTRMELSDPGIG